MTQGKRLCNSGNLSYQKFTIQHCSDRTFRPQRRPKDPSPVLSASTSSNHEVKSRAITHHWSGQVIETPDGLPYMVETAEHQFAATGFSGNGLTFGTLGAMMACDRIVGRTNPWSELFDTGRTKLTDGAWDYVRENKDYPYYLVRDRFAGVDARSIRAVKRGEGKVIELNGAKAAVFRDVSGKVTKRSAICTHLGCLVDWNAAERTWDCACHGSRFKPTGEVFAGPAESPLSELES